MLSRNLVSWIVSLALANKPLHLEAIKIWVLGGTLSDCREVLNRYQCRYLRRNLILYGVKVVPNYKVAKIVDIVKRTVEPIIVSNGDEAKCIVCNKILGPPTHNNYLHVLHVRQSHRDIVDRETTRVINAFLSEVSPR